MHKRKLIAPVIITVGIVLYFLVFAVFCFLMDMPLIVKVIGSLIPVALIGVAIFVLAERISEVRSGEEDDLSNY